MYTAQQDLYNSWRYYVVAAPLLIFAFSWALATYVFSLENPFISTFATVELLPLAALILIGVTAEIENDAIFNRSSDLLRLRFTQNLGVILLFVCYGAIKGQALRMMETTPLDQAIIERLSAFGVFSIATTIAVIAAANYAKLRLLETHRD